MGGRVTITVDDGVADVRLARPEKFNACDEAMFADLVDAIGRIAAMREVRAVVLSGEGKAFCAGIDLEALAGSAALGDLAARSHGLANLFQQAAWGWRTLPQPVIAAVHGYALGAGFQIMLGADIRIAAPEAELAMMEARWGLVPDMGGMALLRGLVRDDLARELVYTGRRFDAKEGVKLGVITRTDRKPRDNALQLARIIADKSPDAVRAAKRLFAVAADADAAAILAAESAEQQALLASPNHREALLAGREKRAPKFSD